MGIKTKGIPRTVRKLRKVAKMGQQTGPLADGMAEAAYTRMRVYAPKRQSKYVRTMQLREKMTYKIKRRPDGFNVALWNRGAVNKYGQRYDQLVKDPAEQAGVHRGFWATYSQDAAFIRPKLLQMVKSFAARIVGG